MPPSKSIHVDTDLILLRIGERIAAIEQSYDSEIRYLQRKIGEMKTAKAATWTAYNLAYFSNGQARTDSEQKLWQRAIRDLAAEGLIETDADARGRILNVRLSADGKRHVEQLQKTPSGSAEQ